MGYSKPEPLRGKHRLEGFSSGEESLDVWLARYARTAEGTGSARVFVATEGGERVVGYYSLSAGSVGRQHATERLMKGQPSSGTVPVVILGRLAVDGAHQGIGLGESLLQDALLRVAGAAEQVGIRALVVHALDQSLRDWYERYGFEQSPTDPLHLILLLKDLRKFLDEV